jgi:hypothetical protein
MARVGGDPLARKRKPQISPLRYAPVEMTILFGNATYRVQANLSSRPERSGVERSAVFSNSKRPGRDHRPGLLCRA